MTMLRRIGALLVYLLLVSIVVITFMSIPLMLIIAAAQGVTDAQGPAAIGVGDFAAAVSFACQNQSWIVYVLVFLSAHLGFSGVSAILKKLGFSKGFLVGLIRLGALDVKPPDATILSQAATIATKQ